jgi:hypothetical protein
MRMHMRTLVLAAFVSAGAAHAQPQQMRISISPKATYEAALVCYQYYSIAVEVANTLEKNPKATADQAAGFQLQALAAKRALSSWSGHIESVKGKRSKTQIDADLKKLGEPVVADVNAAAGGDKAAAERGIARGKTCADLEKIEPA